jgi:hypothetical protein
VLELSYTAAINIPPLEAGKVPSFLAAHRSICRSSISEASSAGTMRTVEDAHVIAEDDQQKSSEELNSSVADISLCGCTSYGRAAQ